MQGQIIQRKTYISRQTFMRDHNAFRKTGRAGRINNGRKGIVGDFFKCEFLRTHLESFLTQNVRICRFNYLEDVPFFVMQHPKII